MSATNVGSSPLAVQFVYFANGSVGPSTTTPLNAMTIPFIEAQFSGIAALIGPLQPYLNTSLGILFNNGWSAANVGSLLQSNFTQTLQQNGYNVSNVGAAVPATGTLWADPVSAVPPTGSTPEQPGSLQLTFKAPGCAISFETPSVTAQAALDVGTLGIGAAAHLKDEWTITFDFQVVFTTSVPLLPFSLAFTVIGESSNADNKPENAAADLDYAANAFIVFLGGVANFLGISLSGSDIPSTVGPTGSQQLESGVDNTETPISGGLGVGALASALNGAGWAATPPNLITYGFTQCGFSVIGGVLTLTITHPLDPAPTLENVNAPSPGLPPVLSNPPALSANASEAQPGQNISALGTNFPVDTTTQINLEWNNTSSGLPTSGQITIDGGAPVSVAKGSPFDNMYFYTAGSLQPNTTHTFQARCGDKASFSSWSTPLLVTTTGNNVVDLTLNSVGGVTVWNVGSANLSEASTEWTCSGQIPASTPPGSYLLTATLSGHVLATTPITIAETLTAVLDAIDIATGIITSPPLLGGLPFTVRGENFPDGAVTITINGVPKATPNAVGGEFIQPLKTPGDLNSLGTVTVTATSGAVSASLPVFSLLGQPK